MDDQRLMLTVQLVWDAVTDEQRVRISGVLGDVLQRLGGPRVEAVESVGR